MNTAANEQSTVAVTLTDASDDDLKAMGLPPSFTLDSLKEFLEPEEIAALGEGDDPLLEVPDDAKPAAKGTSAFDTVRGNKDEATATVIDPDDSNSGADDDGDGDDDDATAANDDGEKDDKTESTKTDADPAQLDDEPVIPDADKPDPVIKPADIAADEEIVATAKQKRKELREKYAEGNLTDDELEEGLEQLIDDVAEAKFRIKDAKATEEDSAKQYASAWYGKVESFMKDNAAFADNSPVPELQGHSALQLFDVCLRHVTDPEKSPQLAHLTQAQKLAQGAKLAQAEFKRLTGRVMTVPAAKPSPKEEPKEESKPVKDKAADDPRPKPVQTLAGVSAATENEVTDGQFAALDRATGMEGEREFSRMTPEQQEAYLRDAS